MCLAKVGSFGQRFPSTLAETLLRAVEGKGGVERGREDEGGEEDWRKLNCELQLFLHLLLWPRGEGKSVATPVFIRS